MYNVLLTEVCTGLDNTYLACSNSVLHLENNTYNTTHIKFKNLQLSIKAHHRNFPHLLLCCQGLLGLYALKQDIHAGYGKVWI